MIAVTELPTLDPSRCTGCADCVTVCPTQCLAMSGDLPWLPRPADCIACKACEVVCPTQAIDLGTPRAA
jgi:NAD-dependent dihydropyrimidine dehydrogenase PreA subunit